jgi:hypothetical protein
MPNYCLNSWFISGKDVYAATYCAGKVSFEIDGNEVEIEMITEYPFEEKLQFFVRSKTQFTLHIRIPIWAKSSKIIINGETIQTQEKGVFIPLAITGSKEISVEFTSEVVAKNINKGIYFEKGALVYSLGMQGDRQIDLQDENATKEFPAYNIYPNEEWRYGIVSKEATFHNGTSNAWNLNADLPSLEVDAILLDDWDFKNSTSVKRCINLYKRECKMIRGEFKFTPRLPKNPTVKKGAKVIKLKLYPYAVCKVRLTVFPWVK